MRAILERVSREYVISLAVSLTIKSLERYRYFPIAYSQPHLFVTLNILK